MADSKELARALMGYGRDVAQGASNAIAGNVSAPVDGLAWLLRKAGVPMPANPMGGSDWMAEKGLTQQPQNRTAGLVGEFAGMAGPMVAAAKAPQIAKGLLQMGENAMVPRTMNPQAGKVFVYPQDKALATAQLNAAKSLDDGGLGLAFNNTPAQRAQAMGYADAYHGTASDIKQIDPKMFGSATGANSAKRAWWAVDDPTTARGYAEYAATGAKVKSLVDEASSYERIAQKSSGAYAQKYFDKYDDALMRAEELEAAIASNPLRGQNIMPLMVNLKNTSAMNAAGSEFVDVEGGINNFLRQAKTGGNDSVTIKNLADDVGLNGRPATHYGVLNPAVVRSRFAAFDPARRNEADILGRANPRLLGAIAGGSLLGIGGYNALKDK